MTIKDFLGSAESATYVGLIVALTSFGLVLAALSIAIIALERTY